MNTIPLGPWPLGIDNVHAPSHRVFQPPAPGAPAARLAGAWNIDLDDEGWPAARPGFMLQAPLTQPRGLWRIGSRVLVQDGPQLRDRASGRLLTTALERRVFLAEFGGRLFGSDGRLHFEVDGDTVRNWGLPVPTVRAWGVAGGTLPAGRYLVQVSCSDARGNEGGVSDLVAVTLTAGQGIALEVDGFNAETTHLNLYAGAADQPQTTFVRQDLARAGAYAIDSIPRTADPPRGAQMTGPWPTCQGAVAFRAFLLLWRDNVIVRSELAEPHLFDAHALMQFPGEVRAVEAVAGGLWVGTDEGLWWVAGDGPETWVPVCKSLRPVARGSALIPGAKVPKLQVRDLVALFVSPDGLLAGLPDGSLAPLTDDHYRFSACDRVSITYVERDPYRQIVVALVTEAA